MTLYAITDDRNRVDAREIKSWWVHFAVALTVSVAALLVLVFNGMATHEFMPRNVQNLVAVAAIGSWTLFYIKRAEAKYAETSRRDRIEREADVATLTALIATLQQEQSALRKLIVDRRKQDGFAEGWLAASNETPAVERGHSTVRLTAVQ